MSRVPMWVDWMQVPSGRRTRIGTGATAWLEQGPGTITKWPVQPVSAMRELREDGGGEGAADLFITYFLV